MECLVLAAVVLGVLCVLTGPRVQAWLTKRGHPELALDAKRANELVHLLVRLVDDHEHGRAILDSAIDAAKSPEAHDLLQDAIQKVRGS